MLFTRPGKIKYVFYLFWVEKSYFRRVKEETNILLLITADEPEEWKNLDVVKQYTLLLKATLNK